MCFRGLRFGERRRGVATGVVVVDVGIHGAVLEAGIGSTTALLNVFFSQKVSFPHGQRPAAAALRCEHDGGKFELRR